MSVTLVRCRCGKHSWIKENLPPDKVLDRECRSKQRYETKEAALGVASHAARREVLMRVYECFYCHGWHLTHKKKP